MFQMRVLVIIILSIVICSCDNNSDTSAINPLNSSGSGGSLARFAIDGNRMYVVNNTSLKTFDISQGKLNEIESNDLGLGIETIFSYQGYLFIGSNDAVYIYDVSNGITPTFVSRYTHATSCDPVVVNGDYAYVSLRASSCNVTRAENVLEILDVSNAQAPSLIKTIFDVDSPYGLGISGTYLFVCQGTSGLKIFDVSDPLQPEVMDNLDINSYDVIVEDNRIILTGADGIYQYDITYIRSLQLLSKIAVGLE